MTDATTFLTWYALVGLLMAMGMLPSPHEDEADDERRASQRRQLRDAMRTSPGVVYWMSSLFLVFWFPLMAYSLYERFTKKKTEGPPVWRPRPTVFRSDAEVQKLRDDEAERIRAEAYEKGFRDGTDRRVVLMAELVVQGNQVTLRPLDAKMSQRKEAPRVSTGS